MPEYIEVKGKKYQTNDDVDWYFYTKEYPKLIDNYNNKKLKNPAETFVKVLSEAVCPALQVNLEDMSIDGKRLKFGEVQKLIIDLRVVQEKIIASQMDENISASGSDNIQDITVKNDDEAIGE